MPRKSARRPRATRARRASGGPTPSRQRKRIFHQCLCCGALVDPIFGLGLGSWCPDCQQPDAIDSQEGQIPDPVLYGSWQQRQKERTRFPKPPAGEDDGRPRFYPMPGETTMKQRKTHTGTYSCLECCIESNLVAEESLKCDQCGGPLSKGSLEDLWAGEDDEGYEGDQR